jgi:hypothetical protein
MPRQGYSMAMHAHTASRQASSADDRLFARDVLSGLSARGKRLPP